MSRNLIYGVFFALVMLAVAIVWVRHKDDPGLPMQNGNIVISR